MLDEKEIIKNLDIDLEQLESLDSSSPSTLVEKSEEEPENVISQFISMVHGVSSEVGENKRMQIEHEHEQKIEKIKLANQTHKRNVLFGGAGLFVLGAVIITALVMGESETAKDFMYIILSAIGGAGLLQFFGQK